MISVTKSGVFSFLLLLEVVEHACGMATLQIGEFVPNASNGIDTYCIREPLGVCAGICPFNFPAMIPLWVWFITSQFFSLVVCFPHFLILFSAGTGDSLFDFASYLSLC